MSSNTATNNLQGYWNQIECLADGESNPEDNYETPQLFICENKFEVRSTSSGDLLIKGTFRLDDNTDPMSIDWTDTYGDDAGKTFPAIFTLTENTFEFCAADNDMERPIQFNNIQGHTIRKFIKSGVKK